MQELWTSAWQPLEGRPIVGAWIKDHSPVIHAPVATVMPQELLQASELSSRDSVRSSDTRYALAVISESNRKQRGLSELRAPRRCPDFVTLCCPALEGSMSVELRSTEAGDAF